jgi:hypothetical protein
VQPIGTWPVVPLFVTFQFLLQPQVLQVEFIGAFRLTQNFQVKIIRAFTLFVGSLLLVIPFQNQPTYYPI